MSSNGRSSSERDHATRRSSKSRGTTTTTLTTSSSSSFVRQYDNRVEDVLDGSMGQSGDTDVTGATLKRENSSYTSKKSRRSLPPATTPGVQFVSGTDHEQSELQLRTKDPRMKHRRSSASAAALAAANAAATAAAVEASTQNHKASPVSICASPNTLYNKKMAQHEDALDKRNAMDQDALIREKLHDAAKSPSRNKTGKYKSVATEDNDYGDDDDVKKRFLSFSHDGDEYDGNDNDDENVALNNKDATASPTTNHQVIASHGRVGAPDLQYGVLNGGYYGEGFDDDDVAIAIAVDDSLYDDHEYYHHAIEYNPDAKPPIHKNRRFRFYICMAILTAVVIGVAICITVPLLLSSNSSANSPTLAPTEAPTTTADGIYREQFIAVVGPQVNVDGSPHDRAATWIMYEDPQRLTPRSDNLIQRYLLALFYFMTTENEMTPWKSCSRPRETEDDSCDLLKFTRNPDDTISYVPEPATRWLSNTHECEWTGITCDVGDSGSIVVALDMWGQNMTGSIPSEISQITFLQSISLGYNNFTGTIPSEFAEMRYLVSLELNGNKLTGSIPPQYWNTLTLQGLNLVENMLTGTLSTEVGLLTNLKGLHLSQNRFQGTLPTELGNLMFLSYARVNGNQLTGAIPTQLGNLSILQELWMHENLLSGTIPTEFGLMPEISELRISNNRIYGTIPEQLWDNKTQLLKLDLNDLLLSGILSSRIGELSSLISIRIRRNRLTGTVPTELALLPNLRLAWLHLNQFTGAIPMCNGPRFLDYLNADCGPDGAPAQECTCCTGCCDRNTELCQLTDDNASS